MCKKITIMFYIISCTLKLFSQSSESLIQYKGGFQLLNRDILYHLPLNQSNHSLVNDGLNYDRYFDVVFKITKTGKIDKSIFVFSMMDSIKAPFIIDAIKYTEGKWINNSGEDQIVILPIYLLYRTGDENDSTKKIPVVRQDYYFNWNKSKVVYLDAIVITSWPGAIDYKIK